MSKKQRAQEKVSQKGRSHPREWGHRNEGDDGNHSYFLWAGFALVLPVTVQKPYVDNIAMLPIEKETDILRG